MAKLSAYGNADGIEPNSAEVEITGEEIIVRLGERELRAPITKPETLATVWQDKTGGVMLTLNIYYPAKQIEA